MPNRIAFRSASEPERHSPSAQMEAWMTIKLFLSIIGALGVLHGAAFIVAPDQVASIYGSP